MLISLGITQMLEAEDAPQGLATLRGNLVNLVFCPWDAEGYPDGSLLREVRARKAQRFLPLIMLDDGMSPRDVVQAVKAGVAGRVSPGNELPALRQALSQLLGELGFLPGGQGASRRPAVQ